MKYSLLSILIASLFLSACGTDDENNIPNNIPKPEQPQSDANTTVLTLGSNNNIASLSNVVQATFSPQDAKNNPVITIRKAKDKDLVEPFNWAKNVLDIENGSDYEVTLSSSKPLSSPVDMELSVPIELFRSLNDQNALAAYIVTTIDDDDSQQAFVPITSTYNPETQKLLVTLPNGSSQPDSENKFFNVIVKIGLAKAVKAESIIPITATARMLTLPVEGELVVEDPNTFKLICPVKNVVCTETSRFGVRKRGTVGKSDHHRGIDLRATSVNSLIAAGAGTVIGIKKDKDNGSIALRVDGGKSTIVYRHMSEIDSNIKVIDEKNNISGHVAAGTILGKAGKVGVTFEHLHLELNRNDALLVCKGTSAINRTCTTRITAPIDPFPAFVNSLKIVNKSPQGTSVTKNQKFNLELQAFDVNGNRINSEIDNRYSESIKAGKKIIQPQGSLRFVNWSVNPSSAYKIESDAKLIPDDTLKYVTTNKDDPKKRSSASVTVNQEESATITASWDGLDNLKAVYEVNSDNTKMEVELLNSSYYHRRTICDSPNSYCFTYHAHLLNMKVTAPMYSVLYNGKWGVNLDCGGWKKISYSNAEGCIRTEGDPPTVNMSWKILTVCNITECFRGLHLLSVYMNQYTNSIPSGSIVEQKLFLDITSPLKVVEFPDIESERPLGYDEFF